MAYTPSTLSCVVSSLGGVGPAIWTHRSPDATTAADLAGFMSDGGKYGMQRNDVVYHTDTSAPAAPVTSSHVVVSVNATTGSVDLSNGTVIGSGTNSD